MRLSATRSCEHKRTKWKFRMRLICWWWVTWVAHELSLVGVMKSWNRFQIVNAKLNTKNISFSPAKTGWFIREDKKEKISQYNCDVYHVNGLTMEQRKRREHLNREDLQKNKTSIVESLTKTPVEYDPNVEVGRIIHDRSPKFSSSINFRFHAGRLWSLPPARTSHGTNISILRKSRASAVISCSRSLKKPSRPPLPCPKSFLFPSTFCWTSSKSSRRSSTLRNCAISCRWNCRKVFPSKSTSRWYRLCRRKSRSKISSSAITFSRACSRYQRTTPRTRTASPTYDTALRSFSSCKRFFEGKAQVELRPLSKIDDKREFKWFYRESILLLWPVSRETQSRPRLRDGMLDGKHAVEKVTRNRISLRVARL